MHGSHPVVRGHRRRWALLAVLAVGVIVAGVVGFRAWLTQPPRRVTTEEAVDRYRSSTSLTQPSVPAGAIPAPGVYAYTTAGSESVDALGGDTHQYPSETTITVTATECGYRLSWVPVTGRSDTTDLCVSDGGLVEAGTANAHEFFRISQDERFVCEPGTWWLPPAGTTEWTAVCHSDTRVTHRSARVVGREPFVVDGQPHDAVHVRFEDTLTGGSSGTSIADYWLEPVTGLLLREVTETTTVNDSVIGTVTFHESIDVTLLSLTPRQ